MLQVPFYDPEKSYEENFKDGPFGAFADGKIIKNKNKPSQFDFLGFKVNSPFGIASGPLVNGKFVKSALEKGFDICIYKTVRTKEYPCHPWPNVIPIKVEGHLTLEKMKKGVVSDVGNNGVPELITNSFGVPSQSPKFWQKDLRDAVLYARSGQLVIGSFQGTIREKGNTDGYIKDFVLGARLLKESGVKVMEVNLSCPNEGSNNLLCFDTIRTKKILEAIKKEIGHTPLIAKIAYFLDKESLKKFIKEIGNTVQAISSINTMPAVVLDEDGKQALPGNGRLISGLCGHAIKWAGLQMVKNLKEIREEVGYSYTIIGVGGVMNTEDFFEYRNVGADIVMSATGAMWNPYLGRDVALEIKKKLI